MTLYADDTDLYCFSKDPKLLVKSLNEDLSNVAQWLPDNKLTLNLDKTKSMIIGSNRKLSKIFHFHYLFLIMISIPFPVLNT